MNRQSNAFALVVGIGTYRDEAIQPLKYTGADARAFAELLKDEEICGVPEENVRLLVDEEATLFNIKDSISGWLASHADKNSTSIIFFAGHGDVEPDRTGFSSDAIANYLLPYDVSSHNLFASALSKEEFERLVRTVRSKRSVIFMDACHAGGVATTGSRKMSVGYSKNIYSSLAQGAGSTVIAAAAPNQLSWEDESLGHGIFTCHLIEALRGAADNDGDGRVTMTEVFEYLKRAVPESARKLGRAEQTPIFQADMSEDIVLTVNPARLQERQEAKSKRNAEERDRVRREKAALFAAHQEGGLSAEAYHFANALVERPQEALSDSEQTLAELMRALMAGHVSAATFERSYRSHLRELEEERMVGKDPLPGTSPELAGQGQSRDAAVAEPSSRLVSEERARPSTSPSVSRELNIAMILASLFMPFAGFIAGCVFAFSKDQEKRRAGKRWIAISLIAGFLYLMMGACAVIVGMYQEPVYTPYGY